MQRHTILSRITTRTHHVSCCGARRHRRSSLPQRKLALPLNNRTSRHCSPFCFCEHLAAQRAERRRPARRYQDQTAALQAQNYTLSEELEAQKGKLKDINDFLVNELKARALSFAVLQSDLTEARKAKDDDKEAYEARSEPLWGLL